MVLKDKIAAMLNTFLGDLFEATGALPAKVLGGLAMLFDGSADVGPRQR